MIDPREVEYGRKKGTLEVHHQGARPLLAGVIFTVAGATRRAAKKISEDKCKSAGCHTPGGKPYDCNCGHSTLFILP